MFVVFNNFIDMRFDNVANRNDAYQPSNPFG